MTNALTDRLMGLASGARTLWRERMEAARARAEAEQASLRRQQQIEAASEAADRDAFEAAKPRFRRKIDLALADYRPRLTQEEVYSVPWRRYGLVAGLLEDECARINAILKPAFHTSGFPYGSPHKAVEAAMNDEWFAAKARFHGKAFAHLHLPANLGIESESGLIMYEPAVRGFARDPERRDWYMGRWTGIEYPNRPILRT